MRTIILFSTIILTLAVSCKKGAEQQIILQGNVLNSNAHIIDTSAIQSSTTSSVFLIKSRLNFRPAIGDILLASPSLKDTLGLLVKIKNVADNGTFLRVR